LISVTKVSDMRIYQNEHNMFTTRSKTDNNALDIDAIDNLKSLIMPKQPECSLDIK
jgi:hypothetical protein